MQQAQIGRPHGGTFCVEYGPYVMIVTGSATIANQTGGTHHFLRNSETLELFAVVRQKEIRLPWHWLGARTADPRVFNKALESFSSEKGGAATIRRMIPAVAR